MGNQGGTVTVEDIAIREEVITAQQWLLSRLRCQFDYETQFVPGGCADGRPVSGPPEPAAFEGVPTLQDVAEREEFMRLQELVLNEYRCKFDIDVKAVPGGCPKEEGSVGAPLASMTGRPPA